ncbi:ubiquinol-cytochrome c reductase iron-sulfur subunit [Flavisolibacter ginsenosidimutans]|uniref:Ubiquinol-cytochrome c reductase iron-sulfur subunit n=1 Tax=Flavisolibacter ginsenosidimutans TaxID=661481 RepID=A0A5B8UCQ7_9BACT|nr:ubiquinol-cytochrome c reductase iron-sulfur subunit [Flavisolibacter ginsenosidimutans]QEC54457.1 ubiquinol-cytochrome c reductase iron-sulfur subunit [Flavisolibacter ginsenosidimutans]
MNEQTNLDRRKFLVRLTLLAGAVPAVLVSVPIFSALLGPLLQRQKQAWRRVASLSDIAVGETKLIQYVNADPLPWAGVTAKAAAWLRRETEDRFVAFSTHCSHLGCPVRWEDKAQLFLCPCHGGVYYKDGSVAAGPPPKPLTKIDVRINKNDVEIRTAPVPITTITQ